MSLALIPASEIFVSCSWGLKLFFAVFFCLVANSSAVGIFLTDAIGKSGKVGGAASLRLIVTVIVAGAILLTVVGSIPILYGENAACYFYKRNKVVYDWFVTKV